MLGLPHAFNESGYVTGTVLLLGGAWFSFFGLHLLGVSAQKVGPDGASSFYTVANEALPGSCGSYSAVDIFSLLCVIFVIKVYALVLHRADATSRGGT